MDCPFLYMRNAKFTLWFILFTALAIFVHWYLETKEHNWQCWQDVVENKTYCVPVCANGTFSLPGMSVCHQWLGCKDNVTVRSIIVKSVVKTIFLAEWNGYTIVESELSSLEFIHDFDQNIQMLISLGPNPFTVQFLGYCNNSIYTQYYKLGSALNFHHHLRHSLQLYNNISQHFKFCLYYASIINYLHTSPVGVRVMCDSSSLEKTLSQYLLTDNLKLVLNDMDAVPEVLGRGIICGHKQLHGTFVAPEQLWLSTDSFSPDQIIPYNEKTDVWKLPDICNWFLGVGPEYDILKFKLFNVHKMCKEIDPGKRPSAKYVLDVYQEVWDKM